MGLKMPNFGGKRASLPFISMNLGCSNQPEGERVKGHKIV